MRACRCNLARTLAQPRLTLPAHFGAFHHAGRATRSRHTFASAGTGSPDLEALWAQHIATEFTEKSADAAVATMVPHATVNHAPVLTGGAGTEALRDFYAKHFIPQMPEDVVLTPIDRTVAKDTVVDEFIFSFTHSKQMDWMLPGVLPTGKHVKVPFIVVVKFEGDKLRAERIYWDQATVLVQLGLLDASCLPCVAGSEQADKAADFGSIPSNGLITKCTVTAALSGS